MVLLKQAAIRWRLSKFLWLQERRVQRLLVSRVLRFGLPRVLPSHAARDAAASCASIWTTIDTLVTVATFTASAASIAARNAVEL